MPRKSSNTADFFMHRARHGKTLFILQSRWGNHGYAFWFKLLEILTTAEGHYFDLKLPENQEYFRVEMGLPEGVSDAEMLETLANLRKIDPDLWRSNKVIWCQNLVDELAETLYRKRNHPPPSKPSIINGQTASKTVPESSFRVENGTEIGVSDAEIDVGREVGRKGGRKGGSRPPPSSPTAREDEPQEKKRRDVAPLISRLQAVQKGLIPSAREREQLGQLQAIYSDDELAAGYAAYQKAKPGHALRWFLEEPKWIKKTGTTEPDPAAPVCLECGLHGGLHLQGCSLANGKREIAEPSPAGTEVFE